MDAFALVLTFHQSELLTLLLDRLGGLALLTRNAIYVQLVCRMDDDNTGVLIGGGGSSSMWWNVGAGDIKDLMRVRSVKGDMMPLNFPRATADQLVRKRAVEGPSTRT